LRPVLEAAVGEDIAPVRKADEPASKAQVDEQEDLGLASGVQHDHHLALGLVGFHHAMRLADLYRVRRFLEKPRPEVAEACLARGGLWNTSVLVVRVRYLLDVGRRLLPELDSRLERLAAFAGTGDERWAMQQAYALAPKADFSRQVLEPLAATLLVRRLPDINWCDLGTPDRAVRAVAQLARRPSWMESLHISA
jgi:mannose-1-phosphate guanylyltransferase